MAGKGPCTAGGPDGQSGQPWAAGDHRTITLGVGVSLHTLPWAARALSRCEGPLQESGTAPVCGVGFIT